MLSIPLFESPFYRKKMFDEKTQHIAHQLREEGFAIIDFPEDDLDSIIDGIKKDLHDKYDWEAWKRGEQNDGLRVQDAWKYDSRVKEIASNQSILALLSTLYGKTAFPFQTLNFPVGTEQSLHSDHVHFNSIPDRFMCGVWLAFEDTDEENGSLFYYPGSHKWPSYSNADIGVSGTELDGGYARYSEFGDLWSRLVEEYGVEKQYFHAKKGTALIWASNLVHGGGTVTNMERTRWSQVTHYYFEDCGYYTPLSSDIYAGEIFYRDLVNISNGLKMPSIVSGREIDNQLISKLSPKFLNLINKDTMSTDDARVMSLLRSFDPARYLLLNPDVKAAGINPFEHYMKFGLSESRPIF